MTESNRYEHKGYYLSSFSINEQESEFIADIFYSVDDPSYHESGFRAEKISIKSSDDPFSIIKLLRKLMVDLTKTPIIASMEGYYRIGLNVGANETPMPDPDNEEFMKWLNNYLVEINKGNIEELRAE
jgi:hypothetical protein